MAAILDWLTPYALALKIALAVIVALGAGYAGYKIKAAVDVTAISSRDVAIAGYQRDLSITNANAATFQNAAKRCSDSVAAVEAETEKVTKASQDALAAARAKGNGLTAEIARLEALKPGADLCTSADEFILENAR